MYFFIFKCQWLIQFFLKLNVGLTQVSEPQIQPAGTSALWPLPKQSHSFQSLEHKVWAVIPTPPHPQAILQLHPQQYSKDLHFSAQALLLFFAVYSGPTLKAWMKEKEASKEREQPNPWHPAWRSSEWPLVLPGNPNPEPSAWCTVDMSKCLQMDDKMMTSLVAQMVKHLPAMQETWVWSPGWEDPLEKERQPTPVLLPGKFRGWRSLIKWRSKLKNKWSHYVVHKE